jgi:hypothetical protein
VENLCYVGDNYRCDLSLEGNDYTELPVFREMVDLGDGSYTATYVINRVGKVSVSIVLASQGGLYGEYFNNAFLDGQPIKTQQDNTINFDWRDGLLTD